MRDYNKQKYLKLLSKEWNLGKKEAEADNDICAWIYLFDILEESETIIKYKDGNRLVGFCGYSKNSSTKYKLRKKFYKFIKNRLYKSKSIKNLKAFKQYETNYNYTPKNLENYFDGEVSSGTLPSFDFIVASILIFSGFITFVIITLLLDIE